MYVCKCQLCYLRFCVEKYTVPTTKCIFPNTKITVNNADVVRVRAPDSGGYPRHDTIIALMEEKKDWGFPSGEGVFYEVDFNMPSCISTEWSGHITYWW